MLKLIYLEEEIFVLQVDPGLEKEFFGLASGKRSEEAAVECGINSPWCLERTKNFSVSSGKCSPSVSSHLWFISV